MPLGKSTTLRSLTTTLGFCFENFRNAGTFGACGSGPELGTFLRDAEALRLLRLRVFNLFSQDAVIDRSQTILP